MLLHLCDCVQSSVLFPNRYLLLGHTCDIAVVCLLLLCSLECSPCHTCSLCVHAPHSSLCSGANVNCCCVKAKCVCDCSPSLSVSLLVLCMLLTFSPPVHYSPTISVAKCFPISKYVSTANLSYPSYLLLCAPYTPTHVVMQQLSLMYEQLQVVICPCGLWLNPVCCCLWITFTLCCIVTVSSYVIVV